MEGDRLYEIVEFILNQATEGELEVVRGAVKRRIEGGDVRGAMGVNPERVARETASSIQKQVGTSIEQIRETVRSFAEEVIRRDAPEVTDEQLRELLAAWVPGAEAAPPTDPAPKSAGIPPEALFSMVRQFVAYSTDSMSVSEQLRLREEIPEWQKRFWQHFTPRLRQLVTLLLNGQLASATFWERVRGELGLGD